MGRPSGPRSARSPNRAAPGGKFNGFAKFPSAALPYASALTGRLLLVWLAYVDAGANWDKPVTARRVAARTGLDIGNVRRCAGKLMKSDWMRCQRPTRTHPDGGKYTFAFLDYEPSFATAGPSASSVDQRAGSESGPSVDALGPPAGEVSTQPSVATSGGIDAAAESLREDRDWGHEPTRLSTRGPEPTRLSTRGPEPTRVLTRALLIPDQTLLKPLRPSTDLVGRTLRARAPESERTDGGVVRCGPEWETAAQAAPKVRELLRQRGLGVYAEGHVAHRLARTAVALSDAGVTPPTARQWVAYLARALRDESIAGDPRVRDAFHVAAWPERVRAWLEDRRRPAADAAPPAEPAVDAAEMRAFVDRFRGGRPKSPDASAKPKRDELLAYERDVQRAALERAESGAQEQPAWFLKRWPQPPADAPPGRIEHERRKREELQGPGLAAIRRLAAADEEAS